MQKSNSDSDLLSLHENYFYPITFCWQAAWTLLSSQHLRSCCWLIHSQRGPKQTERPQTSCLSFTGAGPQFIWLVYRRCSIEPPTSEPGQRRDGLCETGSTRKTSNLRTPPRFSTKSIQHWQMHQQTEATCVFIKSVWRKHHLPGRGNMCRFNRMQQSLLFLPQETNILFISLFFFFYMWSVDAPPAPAPLALFVLKIHCVDAAPHYCVSTHWKDKLQLCIILAFQKGNCIICEK